MHLWFLSDPHFGHENIWRKFKRPCIECTGSGVFDQIDVYQIPCGVCRGSGEIPMRPFSSTNEMDDTIIDRINDCVKPEDHLYMLGDIAMKKAYLQLIKGITCRHLRLILGNHDIFPYQDYAAVGFKKISSYRVIDGIMFSHIPIHPTSLGRFRANVHGHTHTNPGPPHHVRHDGVIVPYVNISVEATNYRPVDLAWINNRIKEIHANS